MTYYFTKTVIIIVAYLIRISVFLYIEYSASAIFLIPQKTFKTKYYYVLL